jgi:hypothetical protein
MVIHAMGLASSVPMKPFSDVQSAEQWLNLKS